MTSANQQQGFLERVPDGVPRPTHCPNNGSFITWLSGTAHVKPALCLRRQLKRVRTVCPLLLVYDDMSLAEDARLQLEEAYGTANMIRMSSLIENAGPDPPYRHGRGLYTQITTTLPKMWIWALPPDRYPLLFYMDLDVLVHENIDDMLAYEFSTPLAAVACPKEAWPGGGTDPRFNAGVLLMKPSLRELESLRYFARWSSWPWNGYVPRPKVVTTPITGESQQWYDVCAPNNGCRNTTCLNAAKLFPENRSAPLRACRMSFGANLIMYRIEKACAPKIGDQSIHNAVFRNHFPRWNRWTGIMPAGINVDARSTKNLTGARLIHFMGEPKPWVADNATWIASTAASRNPSAFLARVGKGTASAAYRQICADVFWKPARER